MPRWTTRADRLDAEAQRLFDAALELEGSDIGNEDTAAVAAMRASAMRKRRQAGRWWSRLLP
ncbi:MAG: hypothetical protein AAGA90_20555 [Actinomycetota bacterium]